MSQIPRYPLKETWLSVVRSIGRGSPGQTIQSIPGIVGAESGLCATIHWDSASRISICFPFRFAVQFIWISYGRKESLKFCEGLSFQQ